MNERLTVATVLLDGGMSPTEVERRLVADGMDSELAHVMVEDIVRQRREARWLAGRRDAIVGSVILAIGVIVTIGSYSAAEGGGTYLLAWGAILFGAIGLLRGLYQIGRAGPRPSSAAEAERRFQEMTPTEFLIHGDPMGQDRLPPSVTKPWECENCGSSMPYDISVCRVCDAYRPGLPESAKSSIRSARWRKKLEESPQAGDAYHEFLMYRHADGAAWIFGKAVGESGLDLEPPESLTPAELEDYKRGFGAAGTPDAKPPPVQEVQLDIEPGPWTCEGCGNVNPEEEDICTACGNGVGPNWGVRAQAHMDQTSRLQDNWQKQVRDLGLEEVRRAWSEAVLGAYVPATLREVGRAVAQSGSEIGPPPWLGERQLEWYREGFDAASESKTER
jgi:hypothetical protein